MRKQYTVTIIATLGLLGVEEKKCFTGTEEEIHTEAHDFMNEVVMRFIDENDIDDPSEQYLIIDCASHTIIWEEDVTPIVMFVVYENDYVEEPVLGIYATRADAEEAIFTECEWYTYEVMMTSDPLDVFGAFKWDWTDDYKYLMKDAMSTFSIQEVPVYM